MLKFVKGHMESIFGIEIFPIISFTIFFTFFVGLLIFVASMKKAYISNMSDLPLDIDRPIKENKNSNKS